MGVGRLPASAARGPTRSGAARQRADSWLTGSRRRSETIVCPDLPADGANGTQAEDGMPAWSTVLRYPGALTAVTLLHQATDVLSKGMAPAQTEQSQGSAVLLEAPWCVA
jgi:hypothetical protein